MRISKILLIQPPYTLPINLAKGSQPPLGLAYIAAVLEKEGYIVKILDAVVEGFNTEIIAKPGIIRYGLSWEEIKNRISEFNPDIVGVSCLFSIQAENAQTVCQIAKEISSEIVTVIGGAHPTACPEEVLTDSNVDFVILGEGEYSFLELVNTLKSNKPTDSIDGLAYKRNSQIHINPKTKFIQNLDRLPFPARHLLPMEKYFRINRPHGSIAKRTPNTSVITSRGCPAKCVFCSIHGIWGNRFRARSPENVVAELEYLKKEYSIKEIQFEDDNLTFDKNRANQIFDLMIQKELNLLWTTPNGIALWALDESLLRKIKESGGYRLCFAVESGDEYVLHNIIHKPLNLEHALKIIKAAKMLKIETDVFFVIGFPQETKAQIENTFRFARNLDVDNINFFIATPYPGTELYVQCKENNLLKDDFAYSNLNVRKVNIKTTNFSSEYLEKRIAQESVLFRLRLMLKHPIIFFNRVMLRFFKQPAFIFNLALNTFKKAR